MLQVSQKETTSSCGGSGMVSHHHSHQADVGLQYCLSAQTTEHTNSLQNVASSWQSKILQRLTSALQPHILFLNLAMLLGVLPLSCQVLTAYKHLPSSYREVKPYSKLSFEPLFKRKRLPQVTFLWLLHYLSGPFEAVQNFCLRKEQTYLRGEPELYLITFILPASLHLYSFKPFLTYFLWESLIHSHFWSPSPACLPSHQPWKMLYLPAESLYNKGLSSTVVWYKEFFGIQISLIMQKNILLPVGRRKKTPSR